jgi:methylated-DNA-protein-cysteine methyltransferase-like protein
MSASRMERADQSVSSEPPSQTGARREHPARQEPTAEERIWQVIRLVPRGRVVTYGQVAALAGLPGRARLVGRTLGRLPAGSRLPWHRVVNASLKISVRADDRAMVEQRRRLEREGVTFVGPRVPRAHLWMV